MRRMTKNRCAIGAGLIHRRLAMVPGTDDVRSPPGQLEDDMIDFAQGLFNYDNGGDSED